MQSVGTVLEQQFSSYKHIHVGRSSLEYSVIMNLSETLGWLQVRHIFLLDLVHTHKALGHYARIEWETAPQTGDGSPLPKLLRGVDRIKDQSYWLSSVSELNLRKVWLHLQPLHNL